MCKCVFISLKSNEFLYFLNAPHPNKMATCPHCPVFKHFDLFKDTGKVLNFE